jgi:hypothetical protein
MVKLRLFYHGEFCMSRGLWAKVKDWSCVEFAGAKKEGDVIDHGSGGGQYNSRFLTRHGGQARLEKAAGSE